MISTTNTCLFQIDLDVEQFDQELAMTVITESGLNRAIQEKLKPVKIVTTLGINGEIIRVSSYEQTKSESGSDSESEEDAKEILASQNISRHSGDS
jgi:hypothetical protein